MITQIEEEQMDPLEKRLIHQITPLRVTGQGNQRTITRCSTGSIPASNDRPSRDTYAGWISDSSGWNHSNQGRAQPSDPDRRDVPELQMTDTHDQTGYSRDNDSGSNS